MLMFISVTILPEGVLTGVGQVIGKAELDATIGVELPVKVALGMMV